MKLTVEIDLENAVFEEIEDRRNHLAQMLHDVGLRILQGHIAGSVVDPKGNTVGMWEFAE